MFDVFDILIPELSAGAPLEVRPNSAVFGTRENAIAYFDELRFAQVLLAKDAYTALEAWTGSAARASWTVLLAQLPPMRPPTITSHGGGFLLALSRSSRRTQPGL